MVEAVALNAALVLPGGTCTAVGTVNCVLLDDREMLSPPEGAGEDNVMAQAACPAPVSVCGPHDSVAADEFCAASSVRDCETLPAAETEAVVVAGTGAAVTVNVELVIPVPIVIVVGRVRLVVDESREMDVLACAALVSVRVHVPVPGVWIVVGVQTMLAFSG